MCRRRQWQRAHVANYALNLHSAISALLDLLPTGGAEGGAGRCVGRGAGREERVKIEEAGRERLRQA